jgi:hypothetical protein
VSNAQSRVERLAARLLLRSTGMTSIPRDSDILGAAALLAIVLVSGLFRVFGL